MQTETNKQNLESRVPTTFDELFSKRLGPMPAFSVKADNALQHIKLRVQETLDELFSEHLIPFKLVANEVYADGPEECTVAFHDSRIYLISFFWKEASSFKEAVRSSVVDGIEAVSAHFKKGCGAFARFENFTGVALSPQLPKQRRCGDRVRHSD